MSTTASPPPNQTSFSSRKKRITIRTFEKNLRILVTKFVQLVKPVEIKIKIVTIVNVDLLMNTCSCLFLAAMQKIKLAIILAEFICITYKKKTYLGIMQSINLLCMILPLALVLL